MLVRNVYVSDIYIRHVTYVNKSCHTHKWVCMRERGGGRAGVSARSTEHVHIHLYTPTHTPHVHIHVYTHTHSGLHMCAGGWGWEDMIVGKLFHFSYMNSIKR